MDDQELLKLHFKQDDERFAALDAKIAAIDAKIDMLLEAHHKQRGFLAGFSMAFTLLASAVAGLVAYVWKQLTGA